MILHLRLVIASLFRAQARQSACWQEPCSLVYHFQIKFILLEKKI